MSTWPVMHESRGSIVSSDQEQGLKCPETTNRGRADGTPVHPPPPSVVMNHDQYFTRGHFW